MTLGRLAGQLDVLCLGHGATLQKIETDAPLLHGLSATQHALEVLFEGEDEQISEAARELLQCVTKPGGAGGFDEWTSQYVQAMLGVNGAHKSFTQRMNDLVGGVSNSYPMDRDTWKRDRGELMAQLAAKLQSLTRYPCAPATPQDDLMRLAVMMWHGIFPGFAHMDDEEKDQFLAPFVQQLRGANAVFDEHGSLESAERRFAILMRSVAAGPYQVAYDNLSAGDRDLLLPPALWADLFDARKPPEYRPSELEGRRTSEIVARIMLDVEEAEAWERVLVADAAEPRGFEFSQAQILRVRALVARFGDQT